MRLLKTSVLSISEKLVSPIRQASFLYRLNVSKRFWVSLVSEELVTFSTPKNLVLWRRHDVLPLAPPPVSEIAVWMGYWGYVQYAISSYRSILYSPTHSSSILSMCGISRLVPMGWGIGFVQVFCVAGVVVSVWRCRSDFELSVVGNGLGCVVCLLVGCFLLLACVF